MALLHRAVLRPTKLDLLAAWLPNRGWYHGPDRADVARVASYRFDGRRETRAPSMTITSSGTRDVACPPVGALHRVVDADPTVVVTDSVELTIVRRLGGGGDGGAGDGSARIGDAPADGVATRATLTGSWDGQPAPLPLAYAVPR